MCIVGALMSILDFGIVILFVIFLWNGYQKGFLKILFSLISLLGSLAISYVVQPYIIDFLASFQVDTLIDQWLLDTLFSSNAIFDVVLTGTNFLTTIESGLTTLALPSILIDPLLSFLTEFNQPLGEALANAITNLFLVILSFLSVFLLSRIVTSMLFNKVTKLMSKNKVISTFDHLLGLGVGFVKASIFIGLIMLASIALSFVNPDFNLWFSSQLQSNGFSPSSLIYQWIVNLLNISL
jgi:uncharacterized membrane protein required for colicin V production